MPGFTSSYRATVLDYIFSGAGTSTSPTNWFIGLFTVSPGEDGSGGTEVSGNGYARVSTSSGDWASAISGQPASITNTAVFTFPTTTGAWGQVLSWGLFTASVGGDPEIWNLLTTSKAISAGVAPNFPAGDLKVRMGDTADSF